MAVRNSSIILNSPRSVFYTGQVITGSLEIEIDSPLTFSVIYVKFLGEAIVEWSEEESEEVNGRKRYKNVNYAGREEYCKGSQLLAGSYGSIVNLNPGKYSYPFQYKLPHGIPSSFTGDRGSVVYSVTGFIEFQTQSLCKDEIIKLFDVVAPFDLNNGKPDVKEPVEMEFEEVYGCGCLCSSEPVTVRVRLPVSAYCPGQVIPVAVAVENKSSIEISRLIFEILTRQRYRAQRPVAEYVPPEEVLIALKTGSIMSGNNRNFTVDLTVPHLIAPNLEDCNIIDVGYFFRITIKLSGCNDDLQDEAEICLGLVPLEETVKGTYVHPMADRLPAEPVPALDVSDHRQDVPDHRQDVPDYRQDVPEKPAQSFPTVPDGTSYFVQVNQQVTSSNPSQNYQMGFKASYPPGSEVPPPFNQQFGQFNGPWQPAIDDNLRIHMDNLMKNNQSFGTSLATNIMQPNLAANNSFMPRSKSPVPSAPPM